MEVMTQVRGDVPLALKRRTFSQLALRGQFFNTWIREQMERWLAEVEAQDASDDLVIEHPRHR